MRRSSLLAASAGLACTLGVRDVGLADALVRIGSTTADDGTPMLYALKNGIFKKRGIEPELHVLASGGAGAPAVVGGALDVSRTSLMALINAYTRNVPLKIIAPGGLYESNKLFAAMVVGKNSPIRTIADLSGKTVGTFALRDLNQLAAMSWVDANGGQSSTIKFVEVSLNAGAAAVESGKLDATTLLSPLLDAKVKNGDVRVLGPVWNGIARRFLISAWFARQDYIEKNAETVQQFTASLRDAARFCIDHPDDTLPLIADFEKIGVGNLSGTVRSSWQTTLDVKEIQPVIDLAAKYKFIDTAFPAEELVSRVALTR